jgi:hypothetical protein
MENTGISFVDRHGFVKGILQYKAYRHVNGEKRLIEDFNDKNLIVNMAREQMAHLIAGDTVTNRRVARISFGVNGTGADVLDEAILNPFTKDVDGYEFPVRTQVRFNWLLSTSEANGMAIREFGLFMANNALFARRVRNTPLNKESDISLEGSWTIIF